MTTISLCQVKEFSKDYKHVANFSSREKQLNWFSSRILMQIEANAKIDNFTDTLSVQLPMTSNLRKCDYLFAEGEGGIYFFFFIDSSEKITASVSKLYLTLDVWQTYHRLIQFRPSYVVRQHVPRWKNNGYPTDEFVSEGNCSEEYVLESRTNLGADTPKPTT